MRILDTFYDLKIVCLAATAWIQAISLAADGPSASVDSEAEMGADSRESDREIVIQPKETLDPATAAREIRKYMELGKSLWNGGDFEMAEKYFAAALGVPVDSPEKENALYEMAGLYRKDGMLPKAAATLERLAEDFGESRKLPSVYMDLGDLYRSMGGLQIAISNYYMVLNASLNISIDQVERARELSLRAKLAIAETHSELLEYEESFRQYELLSKLELKPRDRMQVDYRMCNLLYQLGRYQQAVARLKQFLDQYKLSAHSPEIRYLLAKSYEKLDRKPEALREVVQILQRQSSPDTALNGAADYWRRRMGNELANEFYRNRDYRSALTIYQSLAKYSAAPEWRWPAIHQIGLCFERLGLPEKAQLAYQEILKPGDSGSGGEKLNPTLESLREMAKWRLEHLNWEDDLLTRLSVLGAE